MFPSLRTLSWILRCFVALLITLPTSADPVLYKADDWFPADHNLTVEFVSADAQSMFISHRPLGEEKELKFVWNYSDPRIDRFEPIEDAHFNADGNRLNDDRLPVPSTGKSGWGDKASGDGRRVVGIYADSNNRFHSAYWEREGLGYTFNKIGDFFQSEDPIISLDGSTIVGQSENEAGEVDYFQWKEGIVTSLFSGFPEASKGRPTALSHDGSTIVGAFSVRDEEDRDYIGRHGYIIRNGRYMEIRSIYRPFRRVYPTHVSGNGDLVAGWLMWGDSSSHKTAFFWTQSTGVILVEDYLRNNKLPLGDSKILSVRAVSFDGKTLILRGEFGQAIPETWVLTGIDYDRVNTELTITRTKSSPHTVNWRREPNFSFNLQSSPNLSDWETIHEGLYGSDHLIRTPFKSKTLFHNFSALENNQRSILIFHVS